MNAPFIPAHELMSAKLAATKRAITKPFAAPNAQICAVDSGSYAPLVWSLHRAVVDEQGRWLDGRQ